MKTAEEWLEEKLNCKHGKPLVLTMDEWNKNHTELYKKIQLDAWKQGVKDALSAPCDSSYITLETLLSNPPSYLL